MGAVFIIAGLTVREAVRRKFVFAGLLICLFFFVLVVIPIHPRRVLFFTPDEVSLLIAQMIAMFGGHIAEFFAFLFAIALASGTISNEIERGVLAVILPKPIGRWSVYCGKWLGVNLFVLPFLFSWVCLLQFSIFHHTGKLYPPLWDGYLIMALYPLVFTSVHSVSTDPVNLSGLKNGQPVITSPFIAEPQVRFVNFQPVHVTVTIRN